MSEVKIFWDPIGINLASVGKKTYLRTSDGDTPTVSMPIRMLSIDTAEVHYPGNQSPSKYDAKFAELAGWIQAGKAPVDDGLAAYLAPRLSTGSAGTLQGNQGKSAQEEFEKLLVQKLTLPSGKKRDVFLRSADEPFDQYGRLLAYMAPSYTNTELASMTLKERATFNLLMVDSGWAATFPIYPSIPRYDDLILLYESAKTAFDAKKGAWAEPLLLTGYEYRMCVRLYDITKQLVGGKPLSTSERYSWIYRYCVDMSTREIFKPQDYYRVAPYKRIFIQSEDVNDAVARMNLVPPA